MDLTNFQLGDGPTPVLALHGSAATGRQWDGLRVVLGDEHPLLAPNLPGYGELDQACHSLGPRLAERAQPLLGLLKDIQRPVHVVAHSFGAAIALELLHSLPEAIGSLWLYEPVVPGVLQLSGTNGDLALRADLACLAELLDRASGPVGMAAFVDFWHGMSCWPQLPPSRQALLSAQAPVVLQDFRQAFAQAIPRRALREYAGPVEIAVGESTRMHAARMANLLGLLLPHSAQRAFPDMGHMGPCTHSQTVNGAIVDWIHTVEGSCPGNAFSTAVPNRATA